MPAPLYKARNQLVTTVAMTMALTITASAPVAITTAVTRCINLLVPVVTHEQHRSSAGAILSTMTRPVALMPRRDMQIDRRLRHSDCSRLNHHRLRIDHLWYWITADVDLPIETGLVDTDRHADIGRKGRCCGQCERSKPSKFHVQFPQ